MSRQLPAHPNLDQLKNQAKDLLKAHAVGDPEALKRVRESHPDLRTDPRPTDPQRRPARHRPRVWLSRLAEAEGPRRFADGERGTDRRVDARRSRPMTSPASDGCSRAIRPCWKRVNDPIGPFDSPPLNSARSREMIDALLAAGADLNAKSRWWAGGFGVTHLASPELAAYAVERGAEVDIHAAARLGLIDRVRELVEHDPAARARPRRRRPDAAPLREDGRDCRLPARPRRRHRRQGRRSRVDPRAIHARRPPGSGPLPGRAGLPDRHPPGVGRGRRRPGSVRSSTPIPVASASAAIAQFFPMANKEAGGIIYQWTLGPDASPYQAAAKFGHQDVIRLLLERSPAEEKLIAACWLHDSAAVAELLAREPRPRGPTVRVRPHRDRQRRPEQRHRGRAADARGRSAGHRPGTARRDAAPLGGVSRQSRHGRGDPALQAAPGRHRERLPLQRRSAGRLTAPSTAGIAGPGDYPGVVEALLAAGAKVTDTARGTEAVKDVLRRYGAKG